MATAVAALWMPLAVWGQMALLRWEGLLAGMGVIFDLFGSADKRSWIAPCNNPQIETIIPLIKAF